MNKTDRPGDNVEASPSFDQFKAGFDRRTPQLVFTKLVADLETPVSAYLKLAAEHGNGLLLESVEGGAQRGRYSIIGIKPDITWRAFGTRAEINRTPETGDKGFTPEEAQTLDALRALLDESKIDVPAGLPPMAAGVFGYMGYDTVRLIEHLPNVPPDDLGVPDAVLMRPTVMVIFDDIKDEMTIVTPVRPTDDKQSAEEAYEAALNRLSDIVDALEAPIKHPGKLSDAAAMPAPEPTSNTSESEYLEMVQRAKDYIVAGDIFQVVLSQRFSAPFELSALSLYRALRRINPAPFLFHLDFGDFALVGSSPEILVRVRDGEVTIRPIAGTRRRDDDEAIDRQLEEDLLADPKERAEHLMLLDLGRNDVGRVSEVGTVNVTSQFVIERYSHVMHIVSNVIGQLDQNRHDAVDALMAGFPAGTVSGAPKVRAMEIIDELEKSKRGPYAGCVGYFSADGNMDTCIVLRTALVKDGVVHVQAGAGIVHDSVPESEQQECINKAKAVVRAAEAAVTFAGGSGNPAKSGNNSPFA
ncbi:MAG: anthranilate synthase component I [Filomicrobium sp.]